MSDATTDLAHYNDDEVELSGESTPVSAGQNIVRDAINRLQAGASGVYSSLVGDDFGTRLRVLNAVQNAEPLSEIVNTPFVLKDVVIQEIEMANPQTGEMGPAARVILLTDDNRALYAISKGILSAVINFIGLLGQPSTWPDEGVPVKMTRFKAKVGNGYTLQPVFDYKPTKK